MAVERVDRSDGSNVEQTVPVSEAPGVQGQTSPGGGKDNRRAVPLPKKLLRSSRRKARIHRNRINRNIESTALPKRPNDERVNAERRNANRTHFRSWSTFGEPCADDR